MTPGFEPCSSVAQTDALPIKLKPTFYLVTELRLELRISESKSDVLTITLSGNKAVRMRVELIASDRQSEMLAVTLTNQYSGVLAEAALHTTFQGLAVCTGFEPVLSSRKLDILNP